MSKSIEADREADRKVIQTRNYNGKQFNLRSVEKQNCPILVRDTGVKLRWFYMSKKSNSSNLFLSDDWFSATTYLCIKPDQFFFFPNKSNLTIVISGWKLPWNLN